MKFEIWSEGYAATGQSSGAMFHGTQEAETFQEACDIFFIDNEFYDPEYPSLWGCDLFDNEVNARKYFG